MQKYSMIGMNNVGESGASCHRGKLSQPCLQKNG